MASLINIAALLLSLSIRCVLAIPASPKNGGSFSLPAIYSKNIARDTLANPRNTRSKYRENNNSTLGKRQDSSPPANYNRGIYVTPVTLGANQVLNLHFDTGSADFWVFSTLYQGGSQGHTIYDPSLSTTYQAQQATFNVEYGDQSSASGIVGTETVMIGTTTVTGQWFGLPSQISDSLLSAPDDGIVGLGFSGPLNTVTPGPQHTFFENAQSSLTNPVFTAYLPLNQNGAYTFGAVDASKYTGALNYAPVSSANGYWEFDSESYMVGGTVYDATGITGFGDIASSFILMQDDQVNNYYANVQNSANNDGQWEFPCNANLPTLSFLIGPTVYATIAARYLIYEATDQSRTTCIGSLQSLTDAGYDQTFNVYGLPLFNAYYGVFDASVPQFGFATCINC